MRDDAQSSGTAAQLELVADPVGPFDATTKRYVDASDANKQVQLDDLTGRVGALEAFPHADYVLTDGSRSMDTLTVTGDATVGGQTVVKSGSPGSPSVAFVDALNTGLYSPVTGVVSLSQNGTEALRANSADIIFYREPRPITDADMDLGDETRRWDRTHTRYVEVANGTAAAPTYTFSLDLDSGIFSPSTGLTSISSGGTEIVRVGSNLTMMPGTAQVRGGSASTAGSPAFTFNGNVDTGLYEDGNRAAISHNGSVVAIFAFEGGDPVWYLGGEANDYIKHDLSTEQFSININNNQELLMGSSGTNIENFGTSTTSNAANAYVNTSGRVYRVTSSERYKENITPWGLARGAGSDLLALTPVQFDAMAGNPTKGEPLAPTGDRLLGLTAEDVATNFSEAAVLNEDGEPEAIDWNAITTGLLSTVQSIIARLDNAGL